MISSRRTRWFRRVQHQMGPSSRAAAAAAAAAAARRESLQTPRLAMERKGHEKVS